VNDASGAFTISMRIQRQSKSRGSFLTNWFRKPKKIVINVPTSPKIKLSESKSYQLVKPKKKQFKSKNTTKVNKKEIRAGVEKRLTEELVRYRNNIKPKPKVFRSGEVNSSLDDYSTDTSSKLFLYDSGYARLTSQIHHEEKIDKRAD